MPSSKCPIAQSTFPRQLAGSGTSWPPDLCMWSLQVHVYSSCGLRVWCIYDYTPSHLAVWALQPAAPWSGASPSTDTLLLIPNSFYQAPFLPWARANVSLQNGHLRLRLPPCLHVVSHQVFEIYLISLLARIKVKTVNETGHFRTRVSFCSFYYHKKNEYRTWDEWD